MTPTGQSLRLSAEDIARLAIVEEKDIDSADGAWRKRVPKEVRRLLRAKTKPDARLALESN